jgi:CheY-like chemotaxis protein
MSESLTVLLAEDNEVHARIVQRQLRRAGLSNPIHQFGDGQAILDFLFQRGPGPKRHLDAVYVVLLDINLPKTDGIEVLRQIKADPMLAEIRVFMLTADGNPLTVARCRELGCNSYIRKPVNTQKFADTIQRLGLYLTDLSALIVNGQFKSDRLPKESG